MKVFFTLTFAFNILIFAISAPHKYSKRSAEKMDKELNSSESFKQTINPLQNNKYDIVEADCKSLGNDIQMIDKKEYKISKIGCIYPGDTPIPEDIIQSVYEHFRSRLAQLEN